MKKSVFSFIIVLILCASFIQPVSAYYAQDLESARQETLEMLDSNYEFAMEEKDSYSKQIWNEINVTYQTFYEKIEKAEQGEILEELSEEVDARLMGLCDMNLKMIPENMSLSDGKQFYLKRMKNTLKMIELSNYTELSQDEVLELYQLAVDGVKRSQNFSDIAYSIASFNFEYWEGELEFKLEDYKTTSIGILKGYINEWYSKAQYTSSDWKKIIAIRDDIIRQIKQGISTDDIDNMLEYETKKFNVYNTKSYQLYEDTWYEKQETYMSELSARVEIIMSGDYSDEDRTYALNLMNELEEEMNTTYSLKGLEQLYQSGQKEMGEFETQYAKLQKAKKSAKAKLNRYLNNAKYNQSKVKPIVVTGIAKIEKCATTDAVTKTLNSYVKKAKATVKTFWVKSKSNKGGTITESKKVTYGKSVTFKIKAKPGYKIKKVLIDNKKVKVKNKYSFKNVRQKHIIKVVFGIK